MKPDHLKDQPRRAGEKEGDGKSGGQHPGK
jgi:hypothetical protein